ncbi:MAG TPA: hypothetical protein VKT28_19500 [Puia sp.]|nr:hypothetical protein [Puia sp.]
MKLTTNAEKNYVCPILVDGITNADCSPVRQHSSKPNIGRSHLSIRFVNI